MGICSSGVNVALRNQSLQKYSDIEGLIQMLCTAASCCSELMPEISDKYENWDEYDLNQEGARSGKIATIDLSETQVLNVRKQPRSQ